MDIIHPVMVRHSSRSFPSLYSIHYTSLFNSLHEIHTMSKTIQRSR